MAGMRLGILVSIFAFLLFQSQFSFGSPYECEKFWTLESPKINYNNMLELEVDATHGVQVCLDDAVSADRLGLTPFCGGNDEFEIEFRLNVSNIGPVDVEIDAFPFSSPGASENSFVEPLYGADCAGGQSSYYAARSGAAANMAAGQAGYRSPRYYQVEPISFPTGEPAQGQNDFTLEVGEQVLSETLRFRLPSGADFEHPSVFETCPCALRVWEQGPDCYFSWDIPLEVACEVDLEAEVPQKTVVFETNQAGFEAYPATATAISNENNQCQYDPQFNTLPLRYASEGMNNDILLEWENIQYSDEYCDFDVVVYPVQENRRLEPAERTVTSTTRLPAENNSYCTCYKETITTIDASYSAGQCSQDGGTIISNTCYLVKYNFPNTNEGDIPTSESDCNQTGPPNCQSGYSRKWISNTCIGPDGTQYPNILTESLCSNLLGSPAPACVAADDCGWLDTGIYHSTYSGPPVPDAGEQCASLQLTPRNAPVYTATVEKGSGSNTTHEIVESTLDPGIYEWEVSTRVGCCETQKTLAGRFWLKPCQDTKPLDPADLQLVPSTAPQDPQDYKLWPVDGSSNLVSSPPPIFGFTANNSNPFSNRMTFDQRDPVTLNWVHIDEEASPILHRDTAFIVNVKVKGLIDSLGTQDFQDIFGVSGMTSFPTFEDDGTVIPAFDDPNYGEQHRIEQLASKLDALSTDNNLKLRATETPTTVTLEYFDGTNWQTCAVGTRCEGWTLTSRPYRLIDRSFNPGSNPVAPPAGSIDPSKTGVTPKLFQITIPAKLLSNGAVNPLGLKEDAYTWDVAPQCNTDAKLSAMFEIACDIDSFDNSSPTLKGVAYIDATQTSGVLQENYLSPITQAEACYSVTLVWEPMPCAMFYEVQIANESDFSDKEIFEMKYLSGDQTSSCVGSQPLMTVNPYYELDLRRFAPVHDGRPFYWRVRGYAFSPADLSASHSDAMEDLIKSSLGLDVLEPLPVGNDPQEYGDMAADLTAGSSNFTIPDLGTLTPENLVDQLNGLVISGISSDWSSSNAFHFCATAECPNTLQLPGQVSQVGASAAPSTFLPSGLSNAPTGADFNELVKAMYDDATIFDNPPNQFDHDDVINGTVNPITAAYGMMSAQETDSFSQIPDLHESAWDNSFVQGQFRPHPPAENPPPDKPLDPYFDIEPPSPGLEVALVEPGGFPGAYFGSKSCQDPTVNPADRLTVTFDGIAQAAEFVIEYEWFDMCVDDVAVQSLNPNIRPSKSGRGGIWVDSNDIVSTTGGVNRYEASFWPIDSVHQTCIEANIATNTTGNQCICGCYCVHWRIVPVDDTSVACEPVNPTKWYQNYHIWSDPGAKNRPGARCCGVCDEDIDLGDGSGDTIPGENDDPPIVIYPPLDPKDPVSITNPPGGSLTGLGSDGFIPLEYTWPGGLPPGSFNTTIYETESPAFPAFGRSSTNTITATSNTDHLLTGIASTEDHRYQVVAFDSSGNELGRSCIKEVKAGTTLEVGNSPATGIHALSSTDDARLSLVRVSVASASDVVYKISALEPSGGPALPPASTDKMQYASLADETDGLLGTWTVPGTPIDSLPSGMTGKQFVVFSDALVVVGQAGSDIVITSLPLNSSTGEPLASTTWSASASPMTSRELLAAYPAGSSDVVLIVRDPSGPSNSACSYSVSSGHVTGSCTPLGFGVPPLSAPAAAVLIDPEDADTRLLVDQSGSLYSQDLGISPTPDWSAATTGNSVSLTAPKGFYVRQVIANANVDDYFIYIVSGHSLYRAVLSYTSGPTRAYGGVYEIVSDLRTQFSTNYEIVGFFGEPLNVMAAKTSGAIETRQGQEIYIPDGS